jgi:hypothetical protein
MNVIEHGSTGSGLPLDRARRERVEELLARYPGLTDPEIHEILLFLRKGQVLEIGFLTSNESIRPQLDRFRADHARDLSLGRRELAVAAIVLLILLAAVALLWNAGATQ